MLRPNSSTVSQLAVDLLDTEVAQVTCTLSQHRPINVNVGDFCGLGVVQRVNLQKKRSNEV